jgi:hypothetical protein
LVFGSLAGGVAWAWTIQRAFIYGLHALLGSACAAEQRTKAVHQLSELVTYAGLVSIGLMSMSFSPCYEDLNGVACWARGSAIPALNAVMVVQFGCYAQLMTTERLLKQASTVDGIVHHVITLTLLGMCTFGRYTPMGVMVCLTHDMSTPPLKLSRALHMLGCNKAKAPAFMSFALVFFLSRLIGYPYAVILPSCHQLAHYGLENHLAIMIFVLLLMLYVLDCFFFYKIVGVLAQRGSGSQPRAKTK